MTHFAFDGFEMAFNAVSAITKAETVSTANTVKANVTSLSLLKALLTHVLPGGGW